MRKEKLFSAYYASHSSVKARRKTFFILLCARRRAFIKSNKSLRCNRYDNGAGRRNKSKMEEVADYPCLIPFKEIRLIFFAFHVPHPSHCAPAAAMQIWFPCMTLVVRKAQLETYRFRETFLLFRSFSPLGPSISSLHANLKLFASTSNLQQQCYSMPAGHSSYRITFHSH